MLTPFRILWQIKEEYLEFIKNLSPLVLLLSLFTLILIQIQQDNSGWENFQIALTAVPFGILFFYAAAACVSIFHRKAKHTLLADKIRRARRLHRQGRTAEARTLLRHARGRYFAAAFWVGLGIVLSGTAIVLILAYRTTINFYQLLSH